MSKNEGRGNGRIHLVILGGGSAAFAAANKAEMLGARVTMINHGLPLGGTCLNVGCVPSKALIRAAEAAFKPNHHKFDGIESSSKVTDFKALMMQNRQLIEKMRHDNYSGVIEGRENFRFIEGKAKLIANNAVEVNGERIEADRILIATGSSPKIPPFDGLDKVDYLTYRNAFDLDELPESIIVLGGRYVALELAQAFSRLGSRVTVLQRSPRIIPAEEPDLTDELTGYLREEGMDIRTGVHIERVSREKDQAVVYAKIAGKQVKFSAEKIIAATGQKANMDDMGLVERGIKSDKGFIKVDDTLRTNVDGIYAAGDVIGNPMFVYTATYEGALAAENALNGSARKRDYTSLPWVVFTDPQVAGVGLDEKQAAESGTDYEVTKVSMTHVSKAKTSRDTRGFVKLIRHKKTDKILGARILAHEGSEMLMEISMAIKFGITTEQIAGMFHPYLTLADAVELAAASFRRDIDKMSCCAS